MRLWFLTMLFGSSFLQAATAQVAPAPKDGATHIQLPGADCALFPAVTNLSGIALSVKPTKSFTPTKEQVVFVESSLLPAYMYHLATNVYDDGSQVQIYKNLANYRRQYVGFYNAQHQPCLYINCFPRDGRDFHWLQQLVEAEDGGASYWHICFNLTTKQFFNFAHNGIA